jgi:peptide/nickel transport system permease protein
MSLGSRHVRYLIRTKPSALVGAAIVAVALTLAVFGPTIAPFDPRTAMPGDQLQPPSVAHLMGTDDNGMDIFSRVIASPQTDLTIAIAGTLGAIAAGIPLGLIAGYYRGVVSEILMRVSDIVQSFPVFILGMALVVVTGQEIKNVIYVVAIVNCPIYVRLVRGQVLFLRERPFIEAARAIGGRDRWIIREHILPNAIGPVVANASVTIGWAILLTAGLSFIGAGVRVPTPEWGSMIAVGAKNVYTGEWWPSVFPGVALAFTVLGFALLGETMVQLTDRTRR